MYHLLCRAAQAIPSVIDLKAQASLNSGGYLWLITGSGDFAVLNHGIDAFIMFDYKL